MPERVGGARREEDLHERSRGERRGRRELDHLIVAAQGDRAGDERAVLRNIERAVDGRWVERLVDEEHDRTVGGHRGGIRPRTLAGNTGARAGSQLNGSKGAAEIRERIARQILDAAGGNHGYCGVFGKPTDMVTTS